MKLASVLLCAAALPLAAEVIDDPTDPSQNLTADFILHRPTVFSAAPNTTNVYSGVISGTGPAIIEGGGTVAFSNAGNTYTGGTLVSNAVFRLDADGCAGVNAITAAVNSAHIYFNCSRIPYSIRFLEKYDQGTTALYDHDYPIDGGRALYSLVTPVTVTGLVSFAKYAVYVSGSSKKSKNPTVTYEEGMSADGSVGLSLATYGTTVFEGRLVQACTDNKELGYVASGGGTVEFHSPSNVYPYALLYNPKLNLKATDALPGTIFWYRYGNQCNTDMFGYDQTIRGIRWYKDIVPGENDSGHCFKSSEDRTATLRIVGFSASDTVSLTNRLALQGNMSLLIDIDPTFTRSGFFQAFGTRKNTMTGDIVISNGDFRVTESASFQSVPNIYVATGGMFRCSSTKVNAFSGCTNLMVDGKMFFEDSVSEPFGYKTMSLSLGDKAELTLPADYTLTVLSLKVGDTVMPEGTYGDGEGAMPLDQLTQGTVVVEGIHENVAATWTGEGGSDTSMATAANWGRETAPNLTDSTLLATFASGGTVATAESDVRLRGIVLSKPDTGFTVAGEGCAIALDEAGFTFSDSVEDGVKRTYAFEPSVTQLSPFDMSLNIPTNVTLAFNGGYQQNQEGTNFKNGDGELALGGNGGTTGSWRFEGGSVTFTGTNVVDGHIIATNTVLTFSGVVKQSTTPSSKTDNSNDIVINCRANASTHLTPRIILDNADIGKQVRISGPGGSADGTGYWFTVLPGTTNFFRSLVNFGGFAPGNFSIGANSETTFAAGFVDVPGTAYFRGDGTIVLQGSTSSVWGNGIAFYNNTVCRMEGSDHYSGGGNLGFNNNARCTFGNDRVFKIKPSRLPTFQMNQTSLVDLGTTVQHFATFLSSNAGETPAGSSNSGITGLPGSELRIRRGFIFNHVTNFVSVTSCGTNLNEVFVATNLNSTSAIWAFESYGDVKAESGTFDFVRNVTWLNGTNVTVCSGAMLKVNATGTFGDHAVLHAEGEDWNLYLADGVAQKFAEFYVDGTRQPSGIYGAADNLAVKERYRLANITGGGVIRVGKPGMMLSVR